MTSPSHASPKDRSRVISSITSDMKLKSPNAVHVCMVFEVLSENLLGSD
jgi:hypothetical protein